MSAAPPIADRVARLRALDPDGSFIVQAPAGSGKTGLLTQRFLKLLSGAQAPEEIVAITFTRKAAAEMRQRILSALAQAAGPETSKDDFARQTRELARAALERDRELDWQLLENPNRLRLQTIDSLCARLARQMPILSRFGSLPAVAEDAEPLYLEAARDTLAALDDTAPWSDAVAHLTRHLDNRLDRLQRLIATMLARRDQWLDYLVHPHTPQLDRLRLEESVANLSIDLLEQVTRSIPGDQIDELISLTHFAANHLKPDSESEIARCADLTTLPGPSPDELAPWRGIAELLLTNQGHWRRSVDVRIGFPAASSGAGSEQQAQFRSMKERMVRLLENLGEEEALEQQLHLSRLLPHAKFADGEWETLEALIALLRIAAASLEVVFAARGEVDFPALVRAAIHALGEPGAPTDLALALDHRIRHLLVDEFQDTSASQFELLKRLTSGWQPGDGHTLFVVGDPMQSIYRFREADVGIFIAARESGVGDLPLEFLQLSVNFRSQAALIEWINRTFPAVMAPEDDVAAGAIRFAPSTVYHPPLSGDAVTIHPLLHASDGAEAAEILRIIRETRSADPDGTIALLVRSRAHLADTIALFKREEISFQAVEIELLTHRPVIQDLLALTRALSHAADRTAWLALLRAPWCGLDLADLHLLAGHDLTRTIPDLLDEKRSVDSLSTDGRQRLNRVLPALQQARANVGRTTLRATVEGLWCALGGPACATGPTDLDDCEVYFQLLEHLGESGEALTLRELTTRVERLFALPDPTVDGSLQLMTIHRAKGLQFDTVIIPGLGRRTRGDEQRLLYWLERGRDGGARDLLLAPINRTGDEPNPVGAYLRELDRARDRHEASRLVYVAATRARKRLHLLGRANVRDGADGLTLNAPPQESLLARLWPALRPDFEEAAARYRSQPVLTPSPELPYRRRRLSLAWSLPDAPESLGLAVSTGALSPAAEIEFDWAGMRARHVGTVAHRLLQEIAAVGVEAVTRAMLSRLASIVPRMLTELGVTGDQLEGAAAEILRAVESATKDARGRWILSSSHREAENELALTSGLGGKIDHMIIDRTFVDDAGVRWIIDYKTGTHRGGGVDEFLDREQERYRGQLERYARALARLHPEPIALGLYFPLVSGWREWSFPVEGR